MLVVYGRNSPNAALASRVPRQTRALRRLSVRQWTWFESVNDIQIQLVATVSFAKVRAPVGGSAERFEMAEDRPPRFTARNALDKAQECRELARRVSSPEHRTQVLKMAEAWEELARSLANK